MDIQRISEYPEEMLLPQVLLMVQALVLAMEARLREFILPGELLWPGEVIGLRELGHQIVAFTPNPQRLWILRSAVEIQW